MGKAAGFLLILAGVGTAAYVVPAFDVKEEPRRALPAASTGSSPVSSPASSMTTASIAPVPVQAAPQAVAPRAVPAAEPVREPVAVAKARPSLAVEPGPVKVDTASEPIKVAAGTPARTDQRLALTKEIQRELRRVGCYAGDIDGEWSSDTRAAMKTFIDRVNATLPIDQPDHILKTLVSGHPGDACGRSCPAGQTAAANGRCMPTQVIAQSQGQHSGQHLKRSADRAPVQARPERTVAPREAAPAREFAAADPAVKAPKAPAGKPAAEAVVSSWAPTVVAAAPSVAVPQPRPEARPAELPGRMAVGVGADADSPVAAPAPRAGSKIVIRKREGVAAAAPTPAPAAIPAEVVAPSPAPRQKTAAVTPTEPAAEVEAAIAPPPPRPASRRQGQPGIYRIPSPPPRFVGVYVSPPRVYGGYNSYGGRTAFGPSIFKRLERDAR